MQDTLTKDRKTGEAKTLGRKTPLDVKELASSGHIRGAFATDEQCLMTLEELRAAFPGAVNNAFYVNAQIDEVLILDIEPDCPADVRDELLALPALYRETSMSGKGYHLIMPIPSNFGDFPIATGKRKLQHEKKWFEVLIEHWVTFTRNPIAEVAESSSGLTWEEVWADLAIEAKEVTARDFDLASERPEVPMMDAVVASVVAGRSYGKTLADFHGDHSRWEFGLLGYYWNRLEAASRQAWVIQMHTWSDSDRVWALYEVAQRVLPERDKHHEQRSGLPYLLYAASTLASQREA